MGGGSCNNFQIKLQNICIDAVVLAFLSWKLLLRMIISDDDLGVMVVPAIMILSLSGCQCSTGIQLLLFLPF